MSYKTINFEISGVAPLLMHNGQLANPLNKFAKELKQISSKRKKTDDDHAAMARIEFFGGLYVGEDGRPCIPGEVLEATIIGGAKANRNGTKAKSAIIVDGNFPLIYDGPSQPEQLVDDDRFRYSCLVKVSTAKIVRTRPRFNRWGLKFTVHYLADVINSQEVIDAVTNAGRTVGLCDGRPRFGRFDLVSAAT